MKKTSVERETAETSVSVEFTVDGSGKSDVDTGIGFMDHMLDTLCKHGWFDLKVEVDGDLEVDMHHSVEDIGIVLGNAIKKSVEDVNINRFGFSSVPMDEAIAKTSMDVSGRSYLVMDIPSGEAGGISSELFSHFFRSLCDSAGVTLHVQAVGDDMHHVFEAVFKSFARSLDQALEESGEVLSTKGKLD
ncbi:imidazoleglycerol-phosphate dehydratase HisB [Methanonatronarchaeum sp. AMET6-2]|uniref:imidazoleglycerol-phosphate dehydratase HisB n=1 Tax=Methanonatronarchaeum sp. AMET6-2 TaxID=2933293 RepID=UPI0012163C52|nr:imidazoleglycerol-phosphate dehydratase HisB [Methanonatronarchaeum sp. AMET6-2]RZN62899.1 MAG: imidazoleglycerol-phosphate dehydratase HisB [Methanonatronarchaeia archaeon]UOY09829.1 imidazoleglycerol-phosphate dehydratase HisB [Methanonatronarchaeum sp. AMET6-2]